MLIARTMSKAILLSDSVNASLIGLVSITAGCATTTPLYSIIIGGVAAVVYILSTQALPKMPNATMVIVGEKNSYVLTQGGTEMVSLLSNLTQKNIQVDNDMSFYVPNNDGYFQGEMKLSYAKLKDEFGRADYQFFLQNNGLECTSASDQRMNAQRFCFSVPVKGAIYPQVSNLGLIQSKYRALTKPYTVSFYTKTQQDMVTRSGPNGVQKLVLLPFALAFDVITFPLQLLE